jgi:hypothetical protein
MRSPVHHKVIIFFFFVLVSTGFWIVRSLSEQYVTDVLYPVRYINYPENKVLIGEMPQRLQLRIQARGFNIMKSKLNLNLLPLRFDVNSLSMNSLGTDTFYILTETVKDLLSEELDQVKIIDITPDTLFFRFTDILTRKVPIRPVLSMHPRFFQKQYMQNGDILVFPDSTEISGPGNVVRNLASIPTEALVFTNLSDSIKTECNLQSGSLITSSVQKVQVIIPVDRFTEVEESLSVEPLNVPDSLVMIAIPGQVKITYRICLSNYRKMIMSPLVPRINYSDTRNNDVQRLTVFLADTPRIVSNVRFNPQETEFLITRK